MSGEDTILGVVILLWALTSVALVLMVVHYRQTAYSLHEEVQTWRQHYDEAVTETREARRERNQWQKRAHEYEELVTDEREVDSAIDSILRRDDV